MVAFFNGNLHTSLILCYSLINIVVEEVVEDFHIQLTLVTRTIPKHNAKE